MSLAKNAQPGQLLNRPLEQQTLTVQQALDLAVQYHNAGNLGQAKGIYQQILQAHPNQPVAMQLLGVIAQQTGNDEIAVELITKALTLNPDYPEAHYNLGNALRNLGRPDDAVASYQKALAINPDFAEAHNNLGNVLLHDLGKLDEAAARYRKALVINPEYADAYSNLGNALRDLGRPEEAVDCYHKALAINPNFIVAHNNLGNAFRDLGKLDDAIASHRKALTIDPNFAEAHNNLGTALKLQGRLEDAVTSYKKAIDTKPDLAAAHANRGLVLQDLGRLDEAVDHYRKAIAIKPNFCSALVNLHSTGYGSTDLEPAARYLEEAARFSPEDTKIQFLLGTIRESQGRGNQAKKHFEALRDGTEADAARLDSWQYLKSFAVDLPRLFGHTQQGLQLGIDAAQLDGLIMEFGVRFGRSIRYIAKMAGQDVHGFDSFQGLPEAWHDEPKGIYTTHGQLPEAPENVHFHVGLFEDSLPLFLDEHTNPIRLLNIDCDLYSSTKTVFDLLGNRIMPGSVIVFDEYFGNAHWREDEYKAFQEAVEKFGWQYDYLAVSFFSKQAIVKIR